MHSLLAYSRTTRGFWSAVSRSRRLSMKLTISLIALALLATFPVLVVPAQVEDGDAEITLGILPEPPNCVENPGGTLYIEWEITFSTTPLEVIYELWDETQTTLIETETYPGDTGVAIQREWVVPDGTSPGTYWVRVEYYSVEAGNEANAEVAFLVCEATSTQTTSWGEIKSIYR
jgi:hypothetical protein